MEHIDEHEMMIEYSEMTAFDFNSKEFQEVKNDYLECKSFAYNFLNSVQNIMNRIKPVKNY